MSGFTLTVTNAGRAALVNAANNGTAPVLLASVGVSATAVTPTPSATTLPGEIKRITTLSGDAVADDTIHVTIRDESADVYTVRSLALYLADGTLFALYGQVQPIMEKSAQAMLLLAVDVIFADIDAQQIAFGDTNFLLPPATTERPGQVELATTDETTTGADATRAVTPKGLKTAVTSWLDSRFGEGAPSDFIKGLLTSASAAALRLALGLKSAALKDEGSGKGLDADLLDGQHGSFYTNIIARLGYTPWGPSNDGAGSGLDADLLDGKHGSAYAQADHGHEISAINGLQSALNAKLAASSYTPDDVRAKLLTVDGSGSGLDADLLDGKQGSLFVSNLGSTTTSGLDSMGTGFVVEHTGSAANVVLNLTPDFSSTGSVQLRFGYTGDIEWRNKTDGTAWTGWRKVWTAANDGSGSGLDADLLDGQHGSYYTDIVARLGYTPAPVESPSLRGAVNVVTAGNDPLRLYRESNAPGAGVGAYFQLNNSAGGKTNYALISATIDSNGQGSERGRLRFSTARGGNLAENMALGSDGLFWTSGGGESPFWHAGNDGSGSGLDADLLDGLQASDFAKLADFIASKTANGYCRLPNGMIIQAGRFTAINDGTVTVSFPIAFPNLCMGVVVSGTTNLSADAQDNNPAVRSGSVALASFQVFNAADTTQAFFVAFGW